MTKTVVSIDATGYLQTLAAPSVEVHAGDTVVVFACARSSGSGHSVSGITDGANSLDLTNRASSSGYAFNCCGVKHNCAANAAAVFTATWDTSISYRGIAVYVIHPEAGETITTEAAVAFAVGSSGSPASGPLTTSKASLVLAAVQIAAADVTFSSEAVNGGAADDYTREGPRFDSWTRALSESASSFTAGVGLSSSQAWVCGAIALSTTTTGGADLSGRIDATSAASAALSVDKPLSGISPASSGSSAALSVSKFFSGIVAAVSSIRGALEGGVSLSGQISATSSASGRLSVSKALSGLVAALSGIRGALSVGPVGAVYDRVTMRLSDRQAGIQPVELIQLTIARDLVAHSQEVP